MSGAEVQRYGPALASEWDRLVARSPAGTVLHSRRFLDYHGQRFDDVSLVQAGRNGLDFILPMVRHPSRPGVAVSHLGSSFGGVVGRPSVPRDSWRFLRNACRALLEQDFHTLVYKTTPPALLPQPCDDVLPLLLQAGRITHCDLWAALPLERAAPLPKVWAYEVGRAERKGLAIERVRTEEVWREFHGLLSARLRGKFGAAPAHSAAELADLAARLGEQWRGVMVRSAEGEALAALLFIDYGQGVLHNQYNAATERGLTLGASSYGIARALIEAHGAGFRCFSFGRSTLEDGWGVNHKLAAFKQQFGAGTSAQLTIEADLQALRGLAGRYDPA